MYLLLPGWRFGRRESPSGLGSLVAAILVVAAQSGLVSCAPPEPLAEPGSGEGPASGSLEAVVADTGSYSGSVACRPCHQRFYELWAPSHHGLAMQPYTVALGREELLPLDEGIRIGDVLYTVEVDGDGGRVLETVGADPTAYPIDYALGGKNVYYFLTRLDRGWLQVLPIAFDVRSREWFDTSASAIRHFPNVEEEAVHWRDREYTFNTSCYGCHVSQLETNYDAASDSYSSTWLEPGINCETCHGPAETHIRVTEAAPEGTVPDDLAIIRTTQFDESSTNDLCAPCHAKMSPLTATYSPGDRFYDHFDLITLEHPDFYPDGRDLGENYTMTGWAMSPCAISGELDCVHCHTSSGRFRQADDPDQSCVPCHAERVADPEPHTLHSPGTPGGRCIDCHMPASEFARMVRHDHSMLPPTPETTVAFGSPNACNLCHDDEDAVWAERVVEARGRPEFQRPVLQRAGLVAAAREADWTRLDEMLDYVAWPEHDVVSATSLIRLLRGVDTNRKWQVLRGALSDPSPLVRGAAADALGDRLDGDSVAALVSATRDEYRVVRARAAAALAPVPLEALAVGDRDAVSAAATEYEASLDSRPDDFALHANLGNYYMRKGDRRRAVESFERSLRLRPDFLGALVNVASAYDSLGRRADAEASLRRALEVSPTNVAARFNLALLLAADGRTEEAETSLRAVLETDPRQAQAAYNLGVLLADRAPAEGLLWCGMAWELEPGEPRYGYTYGFFLERSGNREEAIRVLRAVLATERGRSHVDTVLFLGSLYVETGDVDSAVRLFRRAVEDPELPADARRHIVQLLQSLAGSS